jgi:hypothetical protein
MRPKGKVHLIDFVAIALSPVLIMLMVGSLVFFLIEVLQSGKFTGRLDYTFFFFVIAVVLIARISIEQGSKKAIIYGVVLGLACFIAMMAFVEYNTPLFKVLGPVINLGLMALVWWAAHKLTWDCTHLDDDAKASGRGVLAAVGLDTTKSTTESDDARQYDPDRSQTATKKKKKTVERYEEPEKVGLWQRYQQYKEWRKNKPRTPGVWVLYFALAAIPLYGLGQAMIPADDAARRGATFWQMAVYIASALGLLMTTTLLGLKRYLEARNASIPTPLTVAWIGLGGMLVVLFIGVAAILPRPHSETPLYSFDGNKKKQKASNNSVVNDKSAGEGQGAKGQKTEAGDGKSNAKGGKEGGQGKGESKSGSGGQKQGNTSGNKQGEKSQGNNDQGKQGEKSNGPNNKQSEDNNAKPGEKQEGKQNDADNKNEGDADKADDKSDDGNENQSQTMQNITKAFEGVSEVVKWIIWIAIALLVLIGGGYLLLKHASNFSDWAKALMDWFRNLFGKKTVAEKAVAEAEAAKLVERPPPFDDFTNPFTDGTYKTQSAEQLTAYTFTALEAWAWDNAEPRTADETPREFVQRLAEDFPGLHDSGVLLAELVVRMGYSGAPLPKGAKAQLKQFWDVLGSERRVSTLRA